MITDCVFEASACLMQKPHFLHACLQFLKKTFGYRTHFPVLPRNRVCVLVSFSYHCIHHFVYEAWVYTVSYDPALSNTPPQQDLPNNGKTPFISPVIYFLLTFIFPQRVGTRGLGNIVNFSLFCYVFFPPFIFSSFFYFFSTCAT